MREVFGRGDRGDGSTEVQTAVVVVLVVVALCLSFLALTRDPDPGIQALDDATQTVAPSEDAPTSPGSPDGEPSPSSATDTPVEGPPQVADQRRVDFTTTDALPDGARIYDNESVSEGMAVADGALQHGRPRGPVAVSSLETELGDNVRKLGARMRFVGDDPGSVVLVAWQSSFVDSRRDGQPVPASGLRLEASAGSWQLTTSPGDEVLASGEFTRVPGTVNFEVYRRGAEAWVVDPSGTTIHVEDPRIAAFAGRWACWQLLERETAMTPAVIEAVWAG